MPTLPSVLASIPGLGGYLAQNEATNQQGMEELQKASGVNSLLTSIRKQQMDRQLRDSLAAGGGDLTKAMQAAIAGGNLAGAAKLAPLIKLQNDQKLTEQFAGAGSDVGSLTADQLDQLATRAAVANHPGAVGFAKLAEQKRAKENSTNTLGLMRDTPQGVAAGTMVSGTNQQAVADIPPDERAAFEQVARATAAGQPATVAPQPGDAQTMGGGALTPLMGSSNPAIASRAKMLQAMINNPAFKGDAATVQKEIDNLTAMDAKFQNVPQTWHATPQGYVKDTPNGAVPVLGANGRPLMPATTAGASQYANVQSDGQGGWVGLNRQTGQMEKVPTADGVKGSSGNLGNRESVFINRVILSGNEAAKDLANVVKMPLTASRGLLGGRGQAPGIFNATAETLANTLTSQEVQSYNVLATGFQRSLAAIESAGLVPSGSLTHQMDAVIFKEGDTNLTKLQKLAQTRQIVEAGLETISANPRVPEETRNHIKDIISQVQKSVPFSQGDLIELQRAQQTNPNMTLKDVMAAQAQPSIPSMDVIDAEIARRKGGKNGP